MPCVVDQDVEAAKYFFSLGRGFPHRVEILDVKLDAKDF